jgi:hypothetical protein
MTTTQFLAAGLCAWFATTVWAPSAAAQGC